MPRRPRNMRCPNQATEQRRESALYLASMSLMLATSAVQATDPPLAKPNNRAALFDANTETSNDLRRVPVAPGTNAPKGTILIRNARLFDGARAAVRTADIGSKATGSSESLRSSSCTPRNPSSTLICWLSAPAETPNS